MRIAISAAVVLLIAACSSTPRLPSATQSQDEQGVAIARIAVKLVGTPYEFGGADAHGFDCSGLAVYAHEAVGLDIPRTARDQDRVARPVPLSELRPGDLLFFRIGARHINPGVIDGNSGGIGGNRGAIGGKRSVAHRSVAKGTVVNPGGIDGKGTVVNPGGIDGKGTVVNHVGIYTGDGRFVHAPRRGEVVSYASLDDPYFRKRLVRAGRFWRAP